MIYLIVTAGLITAYINGMHDGGTIAATTITSHLAAPRKALIISGISNFIGALLLGTTVAGTIASGMVDSTAILQSDRQSACLFVISAFAGSMIWNIFTWVAGLPSSASHSMIGSMIGCVMLGYGTQMVYWNSVFIKVILAMLISPVIGFVIGYLLIKLQNRILQNATMIWSKRIRALELVSTIMLAISYGSNDSQKVMGLTAIGVAACTASPITIPWWLIAACGGALAIGTMTGGRNMIRAVGKDIIRVDMDKAFASQLSSILVVEFSNIAGLPISSTQVITGSIMGVGTENTPRSVNWTVTGKIILAWIITLPASALMGAMIYRLLTLIII